MAATNDIAQHKGRETAGEFDGYTGEMKAEYTSDGVQLNATAYTAIEPIAEAAITRNGGDALGSCG